MSSTTTPVPPDQFTFPDPAAGFLENRRNYIARTCQTFNLALYAKYALDIDNANQSIDAGRLDPAKVNIPVPTGLAATADGMNTMDGGPVGPVIPLHADRSKTQAEINAASRIIHVGRRLSGNWFQVAPDDTMPAGTVTPPVTSDDGVTGVFEKVGSYMGGATGWYQFKG